MNNVFDVSSFEKEIEKARGGYPIENHIFGSFQNILARPKEFLGRDLNNDEIKYIGKKLTEIKTVDFYGSLYPSAKELLMIYSEGKLTLPPLKEFKRFKTEYGIAEHLIFDRSRRGLHLEDEAEENIANIERNRENNSFRENALNDVDVYLFDFDSDERYQKFGLSGFMQLRAKSDKSDILKYMQEYQGLRYPKKKDLEKVDMYYSKKGLQYCQDKYYDMCMNLLMNGFGLGKDISESFEHYFEKDSVSNEKLEAIVMSILNTFFADYVAGKVVTTKDEILKLDRHLKKDLGHMLERLEYRTKDYLAQEIKDRSIVHAFNGNLERTLLEFRFQPITECYNAELGDRAHCKYKIETQEEILNLLIDHPDTNEIFANLCFSREVDPRKVIGRYGDRLPEHPIYEHFGYDEDKQLFLIDS